MYLPGARSIAGLFLAVSLSHTCPADAAQPHSLTPFPSKPVAPSLELPDIEGRIHNLKDFKGQVVVINFWATWCPPCRKEMPALQRLREQFSPDEMSVFAVNVGDSKKNIAQFFFTQSPPPTYTILMSNEPTLSERWNVETLPTTYIVDKTGRVLYGALGARPWDSGAISALIRELISFGKAIDAY